MISDFEERIAKDKNESANFASGFQLNVRF